MTALRAIVFGTLVLGATAACSAHAARTFREELGGERTVWQGVITGRELATASGVSAMQVTLTLPPDGTWSSICDNGRATGRVIAADGRTLELEGALESGAPVRYRLRLAGPGHAAGSAHTYFAGTASRPASICAGSSDAAGVGRAGDAPVVRTTRRRRGLARPLRRLAEPVLHRLCNGLQPLRRPFEAGGSLPAQIAGDVVDVLANLIPEQPHRRTTCDHTRQEALDHVNTLLGRLAPPGEEAIAMPSCGL